MSTWWLGHIFGCAGLLYSILDMLTLRDVIEGMPSGFRYAIIFFSACYALFQSLRAYERWQSDRIKNAKERIELREMELKHTLKFPNKK